MSIIFDFAFFAEITSDDAQMQRSLLKIFIEQVDGDIAQLGVFAKTSQFSEWAGLCHKIYGAAANVGAKQLAETCDIAQKLSPNDLAQMMHYHQIILTQYQQLIIIISQPLA